MNTVAQGSTSRTASPSPAPLLWLARIAWVVVALCAPWWSLSDGRSMPVVVAVLAWGWALWLITAAALLVPSPTSLTALRMCTPVVVASSIAVLWHGDPTQNAFLQSFAFAGALITWRLAHHKIVVDEMVQGGAYGQEQRFALRTPWPYVMPAILAWGLLSGGLVIGSLLLAAQQWIAGAICLVIGAALLRTVPKRIHRLSRRWLVLVPAGVVVHDHMVLAETMMLRRHNITAISFNDSTGEEADLTGGVLGKRIVFTTRDADKVILTPITARTLGTGEALHVKSFSISPKNGEAAYAALTGSA